MKLITILFLMLLSSSLSAQRNVKPAIDTTVFGNWPSLEGGQISNDGKYVLYSLNNVPKGRSTLVFQSVKKDWSVQFFGASGGQFTDDGKWGVFKTPGDSLCILSLEKRTKQFIPSVLTYEVYESNKEICLAYTKNKVDQELTIKKIASGTEEHIQRVVDYQFNPNHELLLWQSKEVSGQSLLYSLYLKGLRNGTVHVILKDEEKPISAIQYNNQGTAFAFITSNLENGGEAHSLYWYDIKTNSKQLVWKGQMIHAAYSFDHSGNQLVFLSDSGIYYYKKGMQQATLKVNNDANGIWNNLILNTKGSVSISKDGKRIIFSLIEKDVAQVDTNAVKVNVWHYKDRDLQSLQLEKGNPKKIFLSAINTNKGFVMQLSQVGEEEIRGLEEGKKYALVLKMKGYRPELWHKEDSINVYLVSLKDGSRIALNSHIGYGFDPFIELSPDERYLVYYDPFEQNYFSYELASQVTRNLTKGVKAVWNMESFYLYPDPNFGTGRMPVGTAGWIDGCKLMIYDNNDIWQLDPSGIEKPFNMTNGYGRANSICFKLSTSGTTGEPIDDNRKLQNKDEVMLSAFNTTTKESGFYTKKLNIKADPKLLIIGPWSNLHLIKARNTGTWLLSKQSPADAGNLYSTTDFKKIARLTDFQPQKNYNWYTSELVNWKLPNGENCQGILFKPENLDSTKKYPLIFNYYQTSSEGLFGYTMPEMIGATNINVPYFTSRGYLVFMPDIHYKMGHTGESALNSIVSAAEFLSKRSYVDAKRLGLAGHSFGGFETNYVVTHSHLFAAAAEGAGGAADPVSDYLSIDLNGGSNMPFFEITQARIGATPWQRPDLYMENSAVLAADRVITPVLMLQNKLDDTPTTWAEGIKMFLALRRLGKPVWMLEYDGEAHGLAQGKNIKDYTIRLSQFFDHYLKDAPPPRWMTTGIPARLKGIDDGLTLDLSGKHP